jgi:hypothetical protein
VVTFFQCVKVTVTSFMLLVERISMYLRSALVIVHLNSTNIVLIYEASVPRFGCWVQAGLSW